MKTLQEYSGEYIAGVGIIGYSFDCPNCNKITRFVDEEESQQECPHCKVVVDMVAYTY